MHRMYGKPEITSLTKDLEYGTGNNKKLGMSVSCETRAPRGYLLASGAQKGSSGSARWDGGIFSRVPAPFL
jgi:hypothetical protein